MPGSKAKVKPVHANIDPAWIIGRDSLNTIWNKRKHFTIILLFYLLAYVIAVITVGSSTAITAHSGLAGGIRTYFSLIGSLAGTNSPVSGAYQLVLFISLSLVIIWSLKTFKTKKKVSAREAFYKSSTPLIPFFLILLLIALEFIPALIALGLYNYIIVNNIAVYAAEKVFWYIIFASLGALSVYLAVSSVMALYIVASTAVAPMKALKAARALVKGRRLVIFGRILFLPLSLLVIIGIVMLPIILVVPAASEWILFIISLIALLISHSYMYALNQELSK